MINFYIVFHLKCSTGLEEIVQSDSSIIVWNVLKYIVTWTKNIRIYR
jgi:hypothetical protein